ncbi:MAG: hypothetical protein HYZ27_09910, partial [Deltaproteobacteria bacterium]|nr:hypothetical protein [Deltaproteobacteria bacterium]
MRPIDRRPYCDDTGGSACLEVLSRGTGATGNGFCRPESHASCTNPATDYCCGNAAPALCSGLTAIAGCDSYRSRVAIHMPTLRGNIHVTLIDDDVGGDRLQIIVGCAAPNPDDCTDGARAGEWVLGSLDLDVKATVGGDAACFLRDEAGAGKGFEIRTLRFTVRPEIALGADAKPYLQVDDQQVTVDAFLFESFIDVSSDWSDPACYDEGWRSIWPVCDADHDVDCNSICGAGNFSASLVELFEGVIGELLADQLAQAMADQFAERPLEATGALDFAALMPLPSDANPVGYLLSANTDSPDVTGSAGSLGMNLDFDSGFAGDHHPCVPVVTAPAWSLPAPPDPGDTIDAPDPVTGALRPETFHLAA